MTELDTFPCPRCERDVSPRLAWRVFRDGSTHLEARCTRCGGWLRWLPQVEPWLTAALPAEVLQ
jgi:hypothetical protein